MRRRVCLAVVGVGALLVAVALPVSPASAAATRYEAEDATISQGVRAAVHLGHSGSGYVDYTNAAGSYVEWTVTAASAGSATLAIGYANGTTANRPMSISVNGAVVAADAAFNPTGAWNTWATASLAATLNAGSNTVRATAITAGGGPNVDYLDVDAAATPDTDLQAEDATIVQGVVESNHAGFTGTGFVNYDNVAGSYVEWTVTGAAAGPAVLGVRFANGSALARPMRITVNGVPVVADAGFAPTGAWTTWATLTVGTTLSAGTNVVRATALTAGGGPNVDALSVRSGGEVDRQAPTVPGNPRITDRTSTSLTLAWDPSTDNVGVTEYLAYSGGNVVGRTSGTQLTVTGLQPSTAYVFAVAARDAAGNESVRSQALTGTTLPGTSGPVMAAPYVYTGWGDPPNIRTVMNATGVKQFTMAFMLSGGGCVPRWDSARPLRGGQDEAMINAIRAGGGDVQISFGGWSGNKLGPNCGSPTALANAYQQVIDAYNLKYIDIDIENTDEFENFTVMDRILNAMRIIKQNNPGIKTIITFGTSVNGPSSTGNRLIRQAAALNSNFDVFTIMPFDFGCTGPGANMFNCTVSATEGLKNQLKSVFGWTDAQAYAHIGISGMNGKSDVNETTTTAHWEQVRNWANQRHIARLAFWSVNRDRQCSGGLAENCSGVPQSAWQFTSITAGFTG